MAESALLLLPEAAAESDARERLALWDRRPDTTAPLTDRQTDSVLELKAAAENLPVPAEVRGRTGPGLRGSSGARVDLGLGDPCPGSLFVPPSLVTVAARVGEASHFPSRAGTAARASGGWCRRHPARPLRRGAAVREPCPGLIAPGVPAVSEAYFCCPPSRRRGHRTRNALLQNSLLLALVYRLRE